MIIMKNSCVDCALPCVGGYCSLAGCPTVCCDRCFESAEKFYLSDGEVLCRDCFIEDALNNAIIKSPEDLLN